MEPSAAPTVALSAAASTPRAGAEVQPVGDQGQQLGGGVEAGAAVDADELPPRLGRAERGAHRVTQEPVVLIEEYADVRVAVLGAGVGVADHAAPAGELARTARLDEHGEEVHDGGHTAPVLREPAEQGTGPLVHVAAQGGEVEVLLAAESGVQARPVDAGRGDVGAQAPRFTLPAANGRTVSLDALLAEGPVVLTFYRGAWCPYCDIALRALQQHHHDITARGARLVAVSPQVPDESLTTAEKHGLVFDVLSDVGSDTAKQYGLAFDLPDDLPDDLAALDALDALAANG